MPKKKVRTKSESKNGFDKLSKFDSNKFFKGNRSYMSLVYGAVTVIVIFIIIFLGVRAISERDSEITDEAGETEVAEERVYEVAAGDNLWGIAEEVYNDGFAWTVIAEANNLESPDAISEGMELIIPELTQEAQATDETPEATETTDEETQEVPTPTTTPTTTERSEVSGESYTVVEGDHLWGIAVRAYDDGYRWVDIARANNLVNPDLIHPGNVFTLPR